ncbi:MAG: DNA repair protein RecN [Verrucomicrobiota bacterium]
MEVLYCAMLQSLRIRNLAVIEDLTWELESGLNVLTGETGAGKSILIDAFNLILGERADKGMIRDGSTECSVEGVLADCNFTRSFLEQQGISAEGDELLLKRVFYSEKSGKQWINGSPVTLQMLKKLGDLLVDMHGPHDHQSLLSIDEQLKALDAYSGADSALVTYREQYQEWQKTLTALEDLQQTDSGQLAQRLDFLEYQIAEIENADLKPEEEDELEASFDRATHQQRILEVHSECQSILSDAQGSVLEQLAAVQRLLEEWQGMDPQAETFREQNEGLISQINEMLREMEGLSSGQDLDAGQLQELEARLDLIQGLKRKFGNTVEAVLEAGNTMRQERDELSGREGRVAELLSNAESLEHHLNKCARELTAIRKKAAPKLAGAITRQLRFLGFAKSEFEVRIIASDKLTSRGKDQCEFFFSPNPGEKARPLKAVASSGEMARVMLAVKSVLAAEDRVPILIFDEVDANVGGETAVAVGKRLRDLAGNHQVMCITHLPQVAAAGNVHFRVEKSVQKGRTRTQLDRLEGGDREDELSRMLGGKSASAKELAKNLIAEHV